MSRVQTFERPSARDLVQQLADQLLEAFYGTARRRRPVTLVRKACSRGHPDAQYGVTNAEGYRRCRRCLSDSQTRHAAKKARAATAALRKRRRKMKAKAPRPILRPLTPAPAPPVSPPPKVLTVEQRRELIEVRASAPRPPKPVIKPAAKPSAPPRFPRWLRSQLPPLEVE